MQRTLRSLEPRQRAAVVGMLLAGVVAALILPGWVVAVFLLAALCALRGVAASSVEVLEPVVIRRADRRS